MRDAADNHRILVYLLFTVQIRRLYVVGLEFVDSERVLSIYVLIGERHTHIHMLSDIFYGARITLNLRRRASLQLQWRLDLKLVIQL